MGKFQDLTGKEFGHVKVLFRAESPKGKGTKWNCQCHCGNTCVISATRLGRNQDVSCGCRRQGQRKTRLYTIWANMKARCFNPNDPAYHIYGGKGISVCEEWCYDFLSFQRWALQNGYQDDLTIDRKDGNKGYFPENCRWATRKEQTNNRFCTVFVVFDGEKISLSDLADRYSLKHSVVADRYYLGWSVDDLIKPLHQPEKIIVFGQEMTLKEASDKYSINRRTLRYRYDTGCRDEKLIRSVKR